jgi:hypothetical protein
MALKFDIYTKSLTTVHFCLKVMNSHIYIKLSSILIWILSSKIIKTTNSKYLQENIHFRIEDKNVDVCT